jgi:hypothetical protein
MEPFFPNEYLFPKERWAFYYSHPNCYPGGQEELEKLFAERLAAAREWTHQALFNGWRVIDTTKYHAYLELREGPEYIWTAHIYAYEFSVTRRDCSVYTWAPGEFMIRTPMVYDFQALRQEYGVCHICWQWSPPFTMRRISMAGMICPDCAKTHEAELRRA